VVDKLGTRPPSSMGRCAPEVHGEAYIGYDAASARYRRHGSAIFTRLVARNDQQRWSNMLALTRLPLAMPTRCRVLRTWLDNRALDRLGLRRACFGQ
jgi:hypothetical protein